MSGDEEYGSASAEQKLNIATYFIMSTPIGEVDEVIADVSKLVDDPSVMASDKLSSILRDYNTEQMISAPEPNGSRSVLVTKFGQVGDNLYLDPSSGKVLKFDHSKRTFTEETDKRQVLAPNVESYRAAISTAMDKYTSDLFKANKATASVYGSDNGTITICIAAKNVNLGNFWTGSWRSVYSINVGNGGSSELKGNVKLHVHYFEDGNVQLHSVIDHSANINVSDVDGAAKAIVASINTFETGFQNNLEEVYVNMHRNTFKAMRRFLPISKVKFTWNSAAHSLAAEVSK